MVLIYFKCHIWKVDTHARKTVEKEKKHGLSLVDYIAKLYRNSMDAGKKVEEITWNEFVAMVYRGATMITKQKKLPVAVVQPTAASLGE